MKTPSAAESRRELIELFPVLSFWFSLSFSELIRMPRWAVRAYAKALDGLRAEVELSAIRASVYPHLKRRDQRSMLSALRRQLRTARQKSRPLTKGERGVLAAAVGIKVVVTKLNDKKKDGKQG